MPPERLRLLHLIRRMYLGRCGYCGEMLARDAITIDHIVPIARDGSDFTDNLMPACELCNERKGSSTLEEFRALYGFSKFYFEKQSPHDLQLHPVNVPELSAGRRDVNSDAYLAIVAQRMCELQAKRKGSKMSDLGLDNGLFTDDRLAMIAEQLVNAWYENRGLLDSDLHRGDAIDSIDGAVDDLKRQVVARDERQRLAR